MFPGPSGGWRIKPLLILVYLELTKYQIMYMQSHNKKMRLEPLFFVVFLLHILFTVLLISGYW